MSVTSSPDVAANPPAEYAEHELIDAHDIPGPRLPGWLQSYLFFQQLVPFTRWALPRYGDVMQAKVMPFGRTYVVTDPAMVKEIITGPPDNFRAGVSNGALLTPVLGAQGILVLDGDRHMETRKRLLPPFHGEAIKKYEQVIRDETEKRIATWPIGKPIRMSRETRAITLEVIMRTVFGAEDSPQVDELRDCLGRVTHIPFHISWWFVDHRLGLIEPWRSYQRAIKRTNQLLDELIELRRADPNIEQHDDILSLLIRSGETDTDWLRDQLMSVLGAGHETTTTALAWAVELLAHHPAIREKARSEDDAYLDAIVSETLRIRTVIPGVTRTLKRPTTVGRYRFPAGAALVPASVRIHMDSDLWENPTEFRPERFLDDRSPGVAKYFPFGGGVRRCIGAAFAQTEMRVALRAMLDQTDWEPAGRRPERQKNFHITLVPARGARIIRTR